MTRREFAKGMTGIAGGLIAGKGARAGERSSRKNHPRFDEAAETAGGLTDVEGFKVGHFTDERRPTGCTVVLCEKGVVAGVDVRGGAPGTRETDLLNPVNTVQRIYGLALSGGSAFGLDTASGVMRYLDEKGIGFPVGQSIHIPIVPAAILFDLELGDPKIRPTAEAGYRACQNASSGKVAEGNIGAGAGATVGKLFGPKFAMKSGLGTASVRAGDTGVIVAALVAVNAAGDVRDTRTGAILAGARAEDGTGFRDTMKQIRNGYSILKSAAGKNTTIGVVATNASLTKAEATKVAQMAHDGYARAINPVHTPYDGDTVFALSTGTLKADEQAGSIGALAAEVMAEAILRAALQATGILGLPSYRDLHK
ncbi:MAG TPA: P1 family peptidase [Verrucomicrobiae bacterium]|nr:P1 family peptidase [Verrucomicrobiae bacterium]